MINKHGDTNQVRTRANLQFTRTVIKPWRRVLEMFRTHPELNKAGYAAAGRGYIWHNFFYTRASYCLRLVEPILLSPQGISDEKFRVILIRHYFEFWLGKIRLDPSDARSKVQYNGEPMFQEANYTDSLTMCRGANPDWKIGVFVLNGDDSHNGQYKIMRDCDSFVEGP